MGGGNRRGHTVAHGADCGQERPCTADVAMGREVPDFGIDEVGAPLEWGGVIRGRVESPAIRLWSALKPATFIVDAGVKSGGFIPGEPLDGGLVLRAGLGLPLGRR
jgi:hypothetical protein